MKYEYFVEDNKSLCEPSVSPAAKRFTICGFTAVRKLFTNCDAAIFTCSEMARAVTTAGVKNIFSRSNIPWLFKAVDVDANILQPEKLAISLNIFLSNEKEK